MQHCKISNNTNYITLTVAQEIKEPHLSHAPDAILVCRGPLLLATACSGGPSISHYRSGAVFFGGVTRSGPPQMTPAGGG